MTFDLPHDRLLTEKEVADYLRLSPATLRSWRSRGEGPSFVKLNSLGGVIRYSPEDIYAFAAGLRVSARGGCTA